MGSFWDLLVHEIFTFFFDFGGLIMRREIWNGTNFDFIRYCNFRQTFNKCFVSVRNPR